MLKIVDLAMIKTKYLAQVLFLIVIILYTAKFIWHEAGSNYKSLSLISHISAEDIIVTKFDGSGSISYLFAGNSIKQQDSSNISNTYSIAGVRLNKQSPAWELTAATAVWDQASNNITLKDKVQLLLAGTHAATTDWLNINLASNTASTAAMVKFYNNTTAVTALGMELDLTQENITLKHNISGKTTK